jgi:hypothetical protein
MLGWKKTFVGGSVLGLLSVGAALVPAPVHAVPTQCVIASQQADVALDAGLPGQVASGDWKDLDTGVTRPRYGLYYPVTDPTVASTSNPGGNAVPRAQSYPDQGGGSTPKTPYQVGEAFEWVLGGACKDTGVQFSSQGHAIGYCGRSVGVGTGTIGGRSYIIRWESVGSQLVMLDKTATGSVNAQANPPGSANGSCVTGTAIVFLVDGAIVDTTT